MQLGLASLSAAQELFCAAAAPANLEKGSKWKPISGQCSFFRPVWAPHSEYLQKLQLEDIICLSLAGSRFVLLGEMDEVVPASAEHSNLLAY